MSTTADARSRQPTPSEKTKSPDTRRTLTFVGVAAACLAITGLVEYASRPAPIQEYGRVGESFYPEFTDPTLATSLEVDVFDAEEVRPLDFSVERLPNGRWAIPSHHNYPADAKDRLAKTAASVIGITRGAMVTRWPADHAQYGVVNPKQSSWTPDELKGVGKRLILKSDGGTVLADYIIGEKVEDSSDNEYYVRHPEEEEVYIATLDIDLSTRFSDWIDTDLLDITRTDVTEIIVNDYSIDEMQRVITQRDTMTLKRDTSSDPWTLTGLDTTTEEINEDAVRDTLGAIVDMEIAGVRPKQKGLTPDLQLDREAIRSQNDVDRLQSDLLARGFLLQPGENSGELSLVAREGELYAATSGGLIYRLYFGRAFTGSQEELEIGLSANDDAEIADDSSPADDVSKEKSDTTSEAEGTDTDDETEESESEDAEADANDGRPGRYIFVRVEFDKKYLGEAPIKPTEPEMPDELTDAEATSGSSEGDSDGGSDAGSDSNGDGENAGEKSDEEKPADADPITELREEYESAKSEYESQLREYETAQAAYDQKVEDGLKKAEELNRRFAEWYYVIPGSDYEKLKLNRADIVKAKEPEESDSEDTPAGEPQSLNPSDASPEAAASGTTDADSAQNADSEPADDTSPSPSTESEESAQPPAGDGEAPSESTPGESESPSESTSSDVQEKPAGTEGESGS